MSLLELIIAANNKPLNKVCIFALGSDALVIPLLPLTYFLLAQLSDFNRMIKLKLKLKLKVILYLPALALTFLKFPFLYSPYAYLLFLMLLDLS